MANPSHLLFYCFALLLMYTLYLEADAEVTGPLWKHVSSILKWVRSSQRSPLLDSSVIQFEDGYLMETVVEGKYFGVLPHSVHVSQIGDLFGVDSINNNIVRITTPLSQYSRSRSVAGSSQGRIGHVDGRPSDARFNRPKGVTLDDSGNIYVADTANGAIRKITDGGVTTIAGGQSSTPGYRDGPSEQALFSNDFDVVYVRPTCSLIVLDRGNTALRQILLNREDCGCRDNSISFSDAMMVVGGVLAGYVLCTLRRRRKAFLLATTWKPEATVEEDGGLLCSPANKESQSPAMVNDDEFLEETSGEWVSPARLIVGLGKQAVETVAALIPLFVPTPSKDTTGVLVDDALRSVTKTRGTHQCIDTSLYTDPSMEKVKKSGWKDASAAMAVKHRVPPMKHERPEFHLYTGEEAAVDQTALDPPSRPRGQRERSRHRQKSGEIGPRMRGFDPRMAESITATEEASLNRTAKYKHVDSFRF